MLILPRLKVLFESLSLLLRPKRDGHTSPQRYDFLFFVCIAALCGALLHVQYISWRKGSLETMNSSSGAKSCFLGKIYHASYLTYQYYIMYICIH